MPGVFPSEMTGGSSNEDNKTEMDLKSSNPAGRYDSSITHTLVCDKGADLYHRKGADSDMAATILFLAGKGGVFYNHQILVSSISVELYAVSLC